MSEVMKPPEMIETHTLFAIRSRCTLVGTVLTGIQLFKSVCLNSHDSFRSCTMTDRFIVEV